jgi:hypothetical protein
MGDLGARSKTISSGGEGGERNNCCPLQSAQELLHKLECAPRLHGTFVRVAPMVEDRELTRPAEVI